MVASVHAHLYTISVPQPVAGEISQGVINPLLLMQDKHQPNHPQHSLLLSHITEIDSNATILPVLYPPPHIPSRSEQNGRNPSGSDQIPSGMVGI